MDIISEKFSTDLQRQISGFDNIFILTDENIERVCMPKILQNAPYLSQYKRFAIPAGEAHKTLETVSAIWQFLLENSATRRSLLLNIGGGMVTDLGGFAAATFKRGMSFINIPTTLLAAVDAASGGKTGFNFLGIKNQIGVFAQPKAVIIDTSLFSTLDSRNLYSGYAEMLKYGYIADKNLLEDTFRLDISKFQNFKISNNNATQNEILKLNNLIVKSLEIKQHFLEIDEFDHHERKALNFGHTFGHAFEAFSHTTEFPFLHGEAVAWGMVCELFLSHILFDLDPKEIMRLYSFVQENYPKPIFSCNDLEKIYSLMQQDKKNFSNKINFTLLKEIGKFEINQTATKEEIFECFDLIS
jgi:3-dehydroquinate synthase